ncbi:MAG: DUF6106 family protein [Blautia sp.]
MGDLYAECLVKREKSGRDIMVKGGCVAGVVLLVLAGMFLFPLFLIIAVIAAVLAYLFVFPRTDVEYEYLYVNGEMDVDMIFSKSKRKKAGVIQMDQVDLVAPLHSHRLDYYNSNTRMKVVDYSSGDDQHRRYGMVARLGQETCKVILEPDDNLGQLMIKSAPSKVFTD